MKKMNVGSTERYMRLGLGVAAVAAMPFIRSRIGRILLGSVATSGFTTGITRYCPINEALGRGFGVDGAAVRQLRDKFMPTGASASGSSQESMIH